MASKKDHTASGSAIAAGGATITGTGFVAGGVPGAKVDINAAVNKEPGVRGKLRQAKATPGGVLGFRHKAHAGGIYGFKQKATENAWKGPAHDPHEAFFRGRTEGKIHPEEQVLRHLKGGKKAAGGLMAVGAATTAYGLHRRKQVSKADRREKSYSGALLGAGAATAGVSHGTTKLLGSQERKWSIAATRNVSEAGKLVPGMAGPKVRRGKPLTTESLRDADSEVRRNPKTFKNVPAHVAEHAGKLRGAAIQQAHFADVYRDTGKMVGRLRAPGLVAAGAGAGGLALSRKKKPMSKISKLEWSPTATKKQKAGHTAATTPALLASAGGGALMGQVAGEAASIHGWKKGMKLAAKSPAGRVGAGLGAAGIGGAGLAQHVGRKKGYLMTNKEGQALKRKAVQKNLSAFGVEH